MVIASNSEHMNSAFQKRQNAHGICLHIIFLIQ